MGRIANMAYESWNRPLNEIEAGNELIKIINSGDIEVADNYYNSWCYSMRWTPMLATRIRNACSIKNLDASRYGAQVGSRQIREKSNVDWRRLSPNDAD